MSRHVSYADLRDFLRDLEREGDLTRVTAPVDPHLEVTFSFQVTQEVTEVGVGHAMILPVGLP